MDLDNDFLLQGCATVAGWGLRYDTDDLDGVDSVCKTDFSNLSPDKLR